MDYKERYINRRKVLIDYLLDKEGYTTLSEMQKYLFKLDIVVTRQLLNRDIKLFRDQNPSGVLKKYLGKFKGGHIYGYVMLEDGFEYCLHSHNKKKDKEPVWDDTNLCDYLLNKVRGGMKG